MVKSSIIIPCLHGKRLHAITPGADVAGSTATFPWGQVQLPNLAESHGKTMGFYHGKNAMVFI